MLRQRWGKIAPRSHLYGIELSTVRFSTVSMVDTSATQSATVQVTLPRAVRRPLLCGAASSLPRVPEAAYVLHRSDRGRQSSHSASPM